MTYYILQSLMWLLASFFIGACLGCMIKSLVSMQPAVRPGRDELVTIGAGAATAGAGAAILPRDNLRDQRIAEVDRVPQRPYEAQPVRAPESDDLKQVRAIGPDLEVRLHEMGVNSYAQIAGWTGAEVDRISDALNVNNRVSQENWIEQASVLARGEDTTYSGRVERGNYQTIMGAAYDAHYDGDAKTPHISHTVAEVVPAEIADGSNVSPLGGALAGAGVAGAAAVAVAENRSFEARDVADTSTSSAAPGDDLKRIEGIGTSVEQVLREQGVTRYSQIVDWKQDDVRRFNEMLSATGRIERENWIEQAAVLAAGGTTRFATRIDGGVSVAPLTVPAVERFDDAVISQDEIRDSLTAGAGAGPVGLDDLSNLESRDDATAHPSSADVSSDTPDLSSIGSSIAERFSDRLPSSEAVAGTGVIAGGAASLGSLLGESNQGDEQDPQDDEISETIREELVEARVEDGDRASDGGDASIAALETMHEADVVPLREGRDFDPREPRDRDPRGPREGRSDREPREPRADRAPREPRADWEPRGDREPREPREPRADREPREPREARNARSGRSRNVQSSTPDDLKRIRGVGVIVERKLNSMGITTYDHVANWTQDDIDRVNQELDFMGRIERENWIEQARVLGRGGNTDFARRVDRGEAN